MAKRVTVVLYENNFKKLYVKQVETIKNSQNLLVFQR